MSREVQISNHHARLTLCEEKLLHCISVLDQLESYRILPGELSIVFASEEEMRTIHEEHLNDPTLTDVITFEGDSLLDFAGEIFISPDQALHQAPAFKNDFSSELTLYLVHGWLHLAGYDDTTAPALKRMKEAEKEIMHILGPSLTSSLFEIEPIS